MKTVPLHGKRAAGRVALVDDSDYELVSRYWWYVYERDLGPNRHPGGPYAIASIRSKDGAWTTIFMHTLITGYAKTDHADGNGLNNQRHNLRSATDAQNSANRRKGIGTSSRYKGVTWDKDRRMWAVRIGRERHGLGRFDNEEDAGRAYDDAARKRYGEYARLNFPS